MASENDHKAQTLKRWLTDHERLIYRVVVSYEAEHALQQDLFQDIALALWRSVDKYSGAVKESTRIYKVALNTAIDHTRKAQRQPKLTELDESLHWVSVEPRFWASRKTPSA